jgi:hypothetical protein
LPVITGWQGGKPPELELDDELLDEDELPGSGAVGQPPVTGVPVQVALPVSQLSVQSFSSTSTRKDVPAFRTTRLSWLLAGDVMLMGCHCHEPPVDGNKT